MPRCDGVTRRDILTVGSITAVGLGLAQALRCHASQPQHHLSMPNCILVWLDGGPSHLDTFDLKPDAPPEVRGEFKPISTNVDGIAICQHFENLARLADKFCLVRSMTSELGVHGLGSQYVLTGHKPSPVLDYPSFGSVVAHTQTEQPVLPAYIALRQRRLQAGNSLENGYLPESSRPFAIDGDPGKPGFRVRDLNIRSGVTTRALERRREFLADLDRLGQQFEASAMQTARDAWFDQAYRMILSD